jgi:hypothetical protein
MDSANTFYNGGTVNIGASGDQGGGNIFVFEKGMWLEGVSGGKTNKLHISDSLRVQSLNEEYEYVPYQPTTSSAAKYKLFLMDSTTGALVNISLADLLKIIGYDQAGYFDTTGFVIGKPNGTSTITFDDNGITGYSPYINMLGGSNVEMRSDSGPAGLVSVFDELYLLGGSRFRMLNSFLNADPSDDQFDLVYSDNATAKSAFASACSCNGKGYIYRDSSGNLKITY